MDIHKAGGGINFTVEQTKLASEEKLYELFKDRMRRLMQSGKSTVFSILVMREIEILLKRTVWKWWVSLTGQT